MHSTDIVIIGAGPVGLFTIFQAGMLQMRCHVVDTLPVIGGQCSTLYPEKPILDIPAHPHILARELIEKLQQQASPFNPVFHMEQQVVSLHQDDNQLWNVKTSTGSIIQAKAVIIAAGAGAFQPKKPPFENISDFENISVHYSVVNSEIFANKVIVINGGGDSAADWAMLLSNIAKEVHLVHRRSKFRCAPDTQEKILALQNSGKIKLKIPYQLGELHGDHKTGKLEKVMLSHMKDPKQNITIPCDHLLVFFGLDMNLGPIAEWGLNIHRKSIAVTQSTCQTSRKGIYAVGDIAQYDNKVKLISMGFAEAVSACYDISSNVLKQDINFSYSTNTGIPTLENK